MELIPENQARRESSGITGFFCTGRYKRITTTDRANDSEVMWTCLCISSTVMPAKCLKQVVLSVWPEIPRELLMDVNIPGERRNILARSLITAT